MPHCVQPSQPVHGIASTFPCAGTVTHFPGGASSMHFFISVSPCACVHVPPSSRSIGISHCTLAGASPSFTIDTPPGYGFRACSFPAGGDHAAAWSPPAGKLHALNPYPGAVSIVNDGDAPASVQWEIPIEREDGGT